jgi:hypothetical protein
MIARQVSPKLDGTFLKDDFQSSPIVLFMYSAVIGQYSGFPSTRVLSTPSYGKNSANRFTNCHISSELVRK